MLLMDPKKTANQSISSTQNLSKALQVPLADLIELSGTPAHKRYKEITIPKKSGGNRVVYDPIARLRTIQHRINTRIFKAIVEWPSYLYGSLPNNKIKETGKPDSIFKRDYIACAKNHCQAKSMLKLDVADFFDNIHRDLVYEIFTDFFSYPKDVSELLTELCCFDKKVVQGALTSSYLACLCFYNVEGKLVMKLNRRDLVYTRLVDDITISSRFRGYDFANAKSHVGEMLLEKDFPLNVSKTQILRSGAEPLTVHGLVVDFRTPRIPSSEISRIRASVHNIVKSASVNNYRTTLTFRNQFYRCLGRVNTLKRVNHNKFQPLLEKLRKVIPLSSKVDLEKARNSIKKLQSLKDVKSVRYRRTYNITVHRIQIISRSFMRESQKLMDDLKLLPSPTAKNEVG